MDRCLRCEHYERFLNLMDAEDAEEDAQYWAEAESERKTFRCFCDGKPCDAELLAGCFSVEPLEHNRPSDVLRWVCPRFDVNRVSGMLKKTFLALRKR